jgi:hypothetical protein
LVDLLQTRQVGSAFVHIDFLRLSTALDCFLKKSLSSLGITVWRKKKVYRLVLFINSAVIINPLASDFNVSLIGFVREGIPSSNLGPTILF